MNDSYLTIAGPVSAEIEVKRSRFLALLHPTESEEAARATIEHQRRTHHGAGHHCSAFILGPAAVGDGRSIERSNDDGEPGGTAGLPILEVLRGNELRDVVAVVTRYFGGTLLGAGGLVRAYSDAIAAACELRKPLRRNRFSLFELNLDHATAGRVEADLRRRGVIVDGVQYAADAILRLACAPPERAELESIVAGVTSGAGVLRPVGQTWVDSEPTETT